ncbi:XRE family transcriptional regulator [Agrobacterium tumefaciens]|uniref:helix-turn-helix domain-containing protein n=1 Tax=Agrobacterium tumefaciens TaxID=358 RepID=UPI001574C1F6|nr:helix-turn-helix transcriptional regulator [Agrobacterium tumefaciens]NSZ00847.1 XRE family transcriptional regulator [Agrobacterium tumefaciens]NSZ37539.1 XRE family transcriptional regulator [Agrobacterium tumefaciens]NTB22177.1 XRE family transcriptional regulator [Agrobacterium tumefaciens]NTB31045.1 XRE family transcriptional regulator [Agrobacterium tumefaciens]NTB32457.1 XRE family transcriptional regulator [Agrobacterium tumefaciens]
MSKTEIEIDDDDFVVGSGNYLKDRGYADPEEARAKFFLSNEIAVAIEKLGVSQSEAARMASMKQPDVSRIVNGNVGSFSVWRLMRVLASLGRDISIEVQQPSKGGGHIFAVNRDESDQMLALAS